MRNRDLVMLVSDKTGFTRMDVNELLHCLVNTITESLDNGHKVRISGFGTFGFSERKEMVCGGAPAVKGKKLPKRTVPRFWFHRPIHNKLIKVKE